MKNKRFSAISVIKDTFVCAGKLYVPIFIIGLPGLIFSLITSTSNLEIISAITINLVYAFVIAPWVMGTSISYGYQNLTGTKVGINYSFQRSARNLPNLILSSILINVITVIGSIFLLVPGLYLLIRLFLSFDTVVIEDCSAIEGIKRGWKLTQGHWWFVFRLNLLFAIPVFAIIILAAPILAFSPFSGEIMINLAIFSLLPFYLISSVLLYVRLKGEPEFLLQK